MTTNMLSPNALQTATAPQVSCILCTTWARMPYAARYTTPTTVQDTEMGMIVGYWASSRSQQVPRLCARHGQVLERLDQQEELRLATEAAIRHVQPSEEQQLVIASIRAKSEELMKRVQQAALPALPLTLPAPIPKPAPAATEGFVLGPGPLLNGQTAPPNLPVIAPPIADQTPVQPPFPIAEPPKTAATAPAGFPCGSCDFRGPTLDSLLLHIKHQHPSPAEVGTVQGALEAAKAPPVPGAKVSFPCPTCQKPVETGEIHACSG